jgi:hypothetical protein
MYLTNNLNITFEGSQITEASRAKLEAELGIQLSRLLTICEMLFAEACMDQICFLLMYLRRCIGHSSKDWWRSRTKRVAKNLKKSRQGKQLWHVAYGERLLSGISSHDGDHVSLWDRRDSLTLSREDLELGKMKDD